MKDELTAVWIKRAQIESEIAAIDDRHARNVKVIGPMTDLGRFDSDTITTELLERRNRLVDEAARLKEILGPS